MSGYLRYRDSRSKQRQFRIADARDLSLEQARKRADELRGQIALGQDPTEQKAVLRQIPTFEAFSMRLISQSPWGAFRALDTGCRGTSQDLARLAMWSAIRWEYGETRALMP